MPKDEMVRFVVGPDNMVVPDIIGRLPGRGIWLSADRNVIKTACNRNLFAYAARQKVQVSDALDDQVEELLVQRCTEFLGLARRAGQAVSGFVKVKGWLREGRAAILLAASDGSNVGRRKLRQSAGNFPEVCLLRSAELGVAFGREETVHAALAPGGLAEIFLETAARLAGFRPVNRKCDE
jgi:predicted RNA-binding protein YlxR (DUF448 family)